MAIGVVGGLSRAKLNVSAEGGSVTLDPRTGMAVGVSLTQEVGEGLSLVVEGLYAQKGFHVSGDGMSASLELNYLEVPTFLSYRLGGGALAPFLTAGATVSYKASCNAGVSAGGVSETGACGAGASSIDYGIMLGGGVSAGRWSGSVRYTHGLGNVLDEAELAARNRVLMVLVGYRLSGG